MKAKSEKMAVQFAVSTLAAELMKNMFDVTGKVIFEKGEHFTKDVAQFLANDRLKKAREHFSEPEYDRLLIIKNIMQALAEKLIARESDEMLNIVTLAIHAINTGQMYIADEDQDLIGA